MSCVGGHQTTGPGIYQLSHFSAPRSSPLRPAWASPSMHSRQGLWPQLCGPPVPASVRNRLQVWCPGGVYGGRGLQGPQQGQRGAHPSFYPSLPTLPARSAAPAGSGELVFRKRSPARVGCRADLNLPPSQRERETQFWFTAFAYGRGQRDFLCLLGKPPPRVTVTVSHWCLESSGLPGSV